MDHSGLSVSLIFLACTTIAAIITSTFATLVHAKKPIIRATLPEFNIPLAFGYICAIVIALQQSVWEQTPCLAYLWLPFIPLILLKNVYIIKTIRFYVSSIVGRKKLAEYDRFNNASIPIPESLNNVYIDLSIEAPNVIEDPNCYDNFEKFVKTHPYIGSFRFLCKFFIGLTCCELLIPLFLTFSLPQYNSFTGQCGSRTDEELLTYVVYGVFYFVVFGEAFFAASNSGKRFCLVIQLLGLWLAWVCFFILMIMLAFFQRQQPHSRGLHVGLKIMSIIGILIPFSMDVLLPLFWAFAHETFRKHDEDFEGFVDVIEKNPRGWEAIASFLVENASLVESQSNPLLFHGLLFLHDFTQEQKKIKNASGSERDVELCALSVIMWVKYLHTKGTFTWMDVDEQAQFFFDDPSVNNMVTELGNSLQNLSESRDPSVLEQIDTGNKLRQIYHTLVTEIDKKLYSQFQSSIHYSYLYD